jgi:hypothetical protein
MTDIERVARACGITRYEWVPQTDSNEDCAYMCAALDFTVQHSTCYEIALVFKPEIGHAASESYDNHPGETLTDRKLAAWRAAAWQVACEVTKESEK